MGFMTTSATFVDISTLIDQRPGYCDGRPFIAGTGVSVDRIAVLTTGDGLNAEEIAYEMSLSAEQVHAGLAFYYANREAIEADLDERDRLFDEAARAHRSA